MVLLRLLLCTGWYLLKNTVPAEYYNEAVKGE